MLKAQAKINGVVAGKASLRTSQDGKSFVGFNLKVNVPGSRNNMPGKEIFVSVSKEGTEDDLSNFTPGQRIEVEGVLTFRKKDENLYFNFSADNVNFEPEEKKDCIAGTLEFKGTLGNQVEEKTDKKGNRFIVFSGFSTEKIGENFQFTWVRFIKFSEKEPFMDDKAKLHINGKLEVSAYNGRINLECVCDTVVLWNRLPFPPTKDGEEAPY